MKYSSELKFAAQLFFIIGISSAQAQSVPELNDFPAGSPASKPAPKVHKPAPKPAAKPVVKAQANVPPAPPPAPSPQSGETVTQESTQFQSWSVICNTSNNTAEKKHCVAKTGVLRGKDDPRPIIFLGIIKDGADQRFVLQTPTTTELKPGVKIDFGKGAARELQFTSCEPALCTADTVLDPALSEELKVSPTATVSWKSIGAGDVRVTFGLEGARDAIQFLATR